MTPQDRFHLTAFRAALAHARIDCEINGHAFGAIKTHRKPVATPIMLDVSMKTPDTFTAAADDVGNNAEQDQELRTETHSYRIVDVRPEGPLIHIDCAIATELT